MTKAQILVVEDEAIVAQDMANQLEKLGYAIVGTVFSGEEAIVKATETHPDLMLMDIRLRGKIDGIQAAQEILTQVDVPVIYLTAYADDETLARAKLTQPFGYLLKPFELRELHSMIEMALYKHQMERRVKESESKFRTLAETNPAMIMISQVSANDSGWLPLYVNPATQSITGYTLDDLVTISPSDFAHSDFSEAFEQQLKAVLVGLAPAHSEIKIITLQGEERWLDCTYDQIEYNDDGAVLLTAFDITERRQAEQQRLEMAVEREKHKLFRHFIHDTAHDLKTPLTAMRMSMHLLQKITDPEKRDHYFTVLKAQTTHLERLLEDMFNMARLDMAVEPKVEALDLNNLIQEIATAEKLIVQTKNHSLDLILDASNPKVRAEKTQLYRAITNILVNALNYTPEEGKITIKTFEEEQQVGIEISDNGIGISPEDLPHIFERFFRADKARSTTHGGTGLGLAITQKVITMHGGRVEVESTLGEGSTFRLLLPVVSEDDQNMLPPILLFNDEEQVANEPEGDESKGDLVNLA